MVLDWGFNPGPPALEASTLPLGYLGGYIMVKRGPLHVQIKCSMRKFRKYNKEHKKCKVPFIRQVDNKNGLLLREPIFSPKK